MSSSRHCLSLHVSFQALDGVTGQTQEPKSRELVQPPAICQGQIRDWIRLKPLTAFPSVLLLVHLSRRFGGSCHGASLRFAGYTAARPVHARVGQSVELPRVPSSVSASRAHPGPTRAAAAAEPRAFRCPWGYSCSQHTGPAAIQLCGPALPSAQPVAATIFAPNQGTAKLVPGKAAWASA